MKEQIVATLLARICSLLFTEGFPLRGSYYGFAYTCTANVRSKEILKCSLLLSMTHVIG